MVLTFAAVILLGAMSPGPDFVLVVRRAAVSGRWPGTLTALGVAAGVSFWAVAAATGVAALVALSEIGYAVVRLAGAGYLLFLGIRALLAARRAGSVRIEPAGRARAGAWQCFRQGLVCNLFNPKAAVFFVALLPQFRPSGSGVGQTLALSVVAALVTAVWFVTVANLVGASRRLFTRPGVRRVTDAVAGTVLVVLGVRLAVTSP
jgi:threonine/homoserine/homoserine lactone efflux protein